MSSNGPCHMKHPPADAPLRQTAGRLIMTIRGVVNRVVGVLSSDLVAVAAWSVVVGRGDRLGGLIIAVTMAATSGWALVRLFGSAWSGVEPARVSE
jgi:hypothetical protein